jgi:hypothetical protein
MPKAGTHGGEKQGSISRGPRTGDLGRRIEDHKGFGERQGLRSDSLSRAEPQAHDVYCCVEKRRDWYSFDLRQVFWERRNGANDGAAGEAAVPSRVISLHQDFNTVTPIVAGPRPHERQPVEFGSCSPTYGHPRTVHACYGVTNSEEEQVFWGSRHRQAIHVAA